MVLRTINLDDKHFECAGRKFYVHDTISFNRYRKLQELVIEFAYSATFIQIFNNVYKAWEAMNSLKFADAAVILHNIMVGVKKLEDKNDPALQICALFIDEEGEDRTVYDEAKLSEKIDCWATELDVSPFFHFASSRVPDWIHAYKIVSPDGLSKDKAPQA